MQILVLGHKGMLGRAVTSYFSTITNFTTLTTNTRWGEKDFNEYIFESDTDFIINCIGKIPQKKPIASDEYTTLNIDLPRFLETTGKKIIHPSTDCEFNGNIAPGEAYSKTALRDANDIYGQSKATISKEIEDTYTNTKIIRTSIIGHEEKAALSLLDWFLSQTGTIRGYTNHYWNGITTLQWAKLAEQLINDWEQFPTLNQFGTATHHSKFNVLTTVKEIYNKDITIEPFTTEITVNKCLTSDSTIPDLEIQLTELRQLFNK